MDMKLGASYSHDLEILKNIELLTEKRSFEELRQNFPAYTSRILIILRAI
jgi:hypothetical protein